MYISPSIPPPSFPPSVPPSLYIFSLPIDQNLSIFFTFIFHYFFFPSYLKHKRHSNECYRFSRNFLSPIATINNCPLERCPILGPLQPPRVQQCTFDAKQVECKY